MKKTNLLLTFASSFLLVSCGGTPIIEESSLPQSEASSLTSETESQSVAEEGTPIKGDTSRTYLNNALETSFKKKAFSAEASSFKVETTSREYNVGTLVDADTNEYNLVRTNNTEGYSVLSPRTIIQRVGRDQTTFAQSGMYFGVKDATFIETRNGTETSKEEHQYTNVYLKDNKCYYNFLNDQGTETPDMADMIGDLLDGAGTKGYIDLADLEIDETLDALMPSTQFAEYLPTISDMVLDSLADVEGVEFTYEGVKISGEKYYTTNIHITDAKAIYTSIHNMVDNLPDIIVEALGDYTKEDILEVVEALEDSFDFAKTFDLEVTLKYTPSLLKFVDYSFECQIKDTGLTTTVDQEETFASETRLEKIKMSGSAAFTFTDNLTITYPDFTGYEKIEIETDEESEDNPIEIE